MVISNKIKKSLLLLFFFSLVHNAYFTQASPLEINNQEKNPDSLRTHLLEEVVVVSTGTFIKETNALKTLPGSYSILSSRMLKQARINSIPALSSFAPNLYIPEYGSKMSTAMYLRGVGARSSGQTIGIYVDGVPLLNKSSFNFELANIQGIEILRGPQGTLYGRNAMAGIINIHTLSPFAPKQFEITGGIGKYGYFNVKGHGNFQLSESIAIAFAAYGNKVEGYNRNKFTNNWADGEDNAGGRFKMDICPDKTSQVSFSIDYDYSNQTAFPYRRYEEKEDILHPVNYNDEGHYRRHNLTSRLLFNKQFESFSFSSATGFQHLTDKMNMDQDYTLLDLFSITQKQKNNSLTQEFSFSNHSSSNYQWSAGLFGFYDKNSLEVPILFKKDGIKMMLQSQFDKLNSSPQMPIILQADASEDLRLPGLFDRTSWGIAIYHQSTFNNIFLHGLSATAGIRLDYEHQIIDYFESATFPIFVTPKTSGETYSLSVPSILEGKESKFQYEILPKFSIKYSTTPSLTMYFTMAKGYKSGGYNEQIFADLIMQQQQSDLMATIMQKSLHPLFEDIKQTISYKPEYSHNFEVGVHLEPIKRRLTADAAIFMTNTEDLQLTRFVDNGTGRIIVNAGRSRSIGMEASVHTIIASGLTANANYGFTNAEFIDYKTEKKINGQVISFDYKGNRVPFIPRHTYSLSINYNKSLYGLWIDRFFCTANINGAGSIYWDEANTVRQPLYMTLNGRIGCGIGNITLSLWGQNLTDTDYTVFYFESLGYKFKQQAKPLRFGLDCSIKL